MMTGGTPMTWETSMWSPLEILKFFHFFNRRRGNKRLGGADSTGLAVGEARRRLENQLLNAGFFF